jgi:cupin 2 domain-containing protein
MPEPEPRNLFDNLPAASSSAAETSITLVTSDGVTIERIVSHSAASPEGFWYDQAHDEWVLVIKGEADLVIAPDTRHRLKPGDHLLLPAHCRHRVAWTSAETIWLAIHLAPDTPPLP